MPMTLHPSHHARTMPDKPAYRMVGSGSAITYGELDRVSDQGAQQLRALGLKPQDHIALLAENSLCRHSLRRSLLARRRPGRQFLCDNPVGDELADAGAPADFIDDRAAVGAERRRSEQWIDRVRENRRERLQGGAAAISPAKPPSPKSSSQRTLRWRKADSNF
jgi:hypothetical protein